jgi:peptide/nickel transport system permease protein
MTRIVVRRLGAMVLILLALAAVEFMLQKLSPVDPVKVLLGANTSPAAQAAARHKLGLDRPLFVQYLRYVWGLLHGQLGISIRTGDPVRSDVRSLLPATAELMGFAIVIAFVLAALLGIASAARWRGSGLLRGLMVGGASVPPFLLALLGILILSNKLGWLPGSGRTSILTAPTGPTGFLTIDSLIAGRFNVFVDALRHLVMPAVCIALISAVSVGRILRGSLIDNLEADYCRSALSKGLSRREVLTNHALRNSLGPALSIAGLQLGVMFASVIVVEQIFAWPGLGSYLAQSIPANDYTAISAVTLILGAAYVVTNTLVDLAQAIADPRIRV